MHYDNGDTRVSDWLLYWCGMFIVNFVAAKIPANILLGPIAIQFAFNVLYNIAAYCFFPSGIKSYILAAVIVVIVLLLIGIILTYFIKADMSDLLPSFTNSFNEGMDMGRGYLNSFLFN